MNRDNPARIGLSDEGDALMSQAVSVADPQENLDATVQPLTNSTMKVLEGLIDMESEVTTVADSDSSNESINILAEIYF